MLRSAVRSIAVGLLIAGFLFVRYGPSPAALAIDFTFIVVVLLLADLLISRHDAEFFTRIEALIWQAIERLRVTVAPTDRGYMNIQVGFREPRPEPEESIDITSRPRDGIEELRSEIRARTDELLARQREMRRAIDELTSAAHAQIERQERQLFHQLRQAAEDELLEQLALDAADEYEPDRAAYNYLRPPDGGAAGSTDDDDFEAIRLELAPTDEPPRGAEPQERHVNVWIDDHDGFSPLELDNRYTLNINVGRHVAMSLLFDPRSLVPDSEVPSGGLSTAWVIRSSTVAIESLPENDAECSVSQVDARRVWTAKFNLHIPPGGESEVRQLVVVPLTSDDPHLDVLVFAGHELYREFTVRLSVDELDSPVAVTDDVVHTRAADANLVTTYEWTTPPGHMMLKIRRDSVDVRVDSPEGHIDEEELWNNDTAALAGVVQNVRAAAERFRATHEKYLNAIDPADLPWRLRDHYGSDNWTDSASPDAEHEAAWDVVANSSELRELATEGYVLYDRTFPARTKLRERIDSLPDGHRIDITWFAKDRAPLTSIPWSLMYRELPGSKVDALNFMGLRYRIAYTPQPGGGAKALGHQDDTHRACCFYWGGQPDDRTGIEARWQQQVFANWKNQKFVPADGDASPKEVLRAMLKTPAPRPVNLLYMFCQCSTGKGNDPVLRFGPTTDDVHTLKASDLVLPVFDDAPLVFANACSTSASDPYIANELQQRFFDRGCRAYLGTETKVPIELASRFAWIFFHYFYRIVAPEPMAAGEAVMQTRRFLWANYRNIGGIFYSYVNQYELFMARESEVHALRSPHATHA